MKEYIFSKNLLKINKKKKNNKKLILYWKDILGIYKSKNSGDVDILIKMKNGMKIIFSAPFKKKFWTNDYFLEEFISYINNCIYNEHKTD